MTNRRTWGYPGDQDISPRRLYPEILAAESTFSSIGSTELTVDFSKEEDFEEDEEQPYSNTAPTEHCTRRIQSRLTIPTARNRSHSTSKSNTSAASDATHKRKSHGEKFQENHDSVASFFDKAADCVGDVAQFIIFIALILLAGYMLYWLFWPATPVIGHSLTADINAITIEEFGGDRRVRVVLKYIFEILSEKEPKAPVAVLLVGHTNITERFLEPLRRLLVDYNGRKPLDLSIPADGSVTRRQLEALLVDYLYDDDGGNRVVFMRSIDHLPQSTPLLLHALCDSETAPYKNLMLIATLSPPHFPLSVVSRSGGASTTLQKRECDEHVTNHLLDAWNFLKPDKIHPIVSRISAILLCLI